MISPSSQWAIMIDITNQCHLHCSNCTRALDHRTKETSFYMSPECFRKACEALKDFPYESDPCPGIHCGRRKVIGIIGGEPLLHPEFPTLVDIMCEVIPDVRVRGLWTSKDWMSGSHPRWGKYRPHVERLIGELPTHDASGPLSKHTSGYINWNMHLPRMNVHHQPILVASRDVVPDEERRWQLISQCWVQEQWSSTITPKGFFFCEVAGALDMIMGGPGGLPVTPDVWRHPLTFTGRDRRLVPQGPYAAQINRWCESCGACIPLPGRLDSENVDDISPSNFLRLEKIRSPRIAREEVILHTESSYDEQNRNGWRPMQYVKAQPPKDQAAVSRGEEDHDVSAQRRDTV